MDNFDNPYLIVPVATWLAAQVVKFVYAASKGEANFFYLWQGGGILASHVAVAVALAVTALTVDGLDSPLVGVTGVLAGAVVYNAATIGRNAWRQSTAIHELVKEVKHRLPTDIADLNLLLVPERSSAELSRGALFGVLAALAMTTRHWTDDLDWLFATPGLSERYLLSALFAFALAGGFVVDSVWGSRYRRRLPTSRRIRRAVRWSLIVPGLVGLGLTVAQRNAWQPWDDRLWPLSVLVWLAVGSAVAYRRVYSLAGIRLAEEEAHFKARKAAKRRKKSAPKRKRK